MIEELPSSEEVISDGPVLTISSFPQKYSEAVAGMGYETPSPIQERAIAPLLEGCDLLGVAQTGTGKTAAFALPLSPAWTRSLRPYKSLPRPYPGACHSGG